MGGKSFMTTKERDYVAECLRRNMRYFRSDIDYAALLVGGERIDVRGDDGEPRRSFHLVFGKESRKSARRPRPFFGVPVESTQPALRDKLQLEEVIDLYTVGRRCKLSDEEAAENGNAVRAGLASGFGAFVSIAKFFVFLEEYFAEAGERERREAVGELQRTFHLVKDVAGFYRCIGELVNLIPAVGEAELEAGFVSTFLFFPSGVILATSLLIQNEELCKVFYDAVAADGVWSFTKHRYGWQFLSVLVSTADMEKQKAIVEMARPHLLRIAKDGSKDEIDNVKLFLEAIGVEADDFREWSR